MSANRGQIADGSRQGARRYRAALETDQNGLLSTEQFGNLATTRRSYNLDGQLETISTLADVPLQSLSYSYDQNGNVETRADASRTTTYTFDGFNRLTGDDSVGPSFVYSAIGNIPVGDYNRPQPHQLGTDNLFTYDYVAGNRTAKTGNGSTPFVEKTSYTAFDLPARIWNEEVAGAPHNQVTLSYDADQNRARKDTDSSTTLYIGDLSERRTPKNGAPATFVYYLTNGSRVVAQVSVTGTSAVISYLHDDIVGSVHVVSGARDAAGHVSSTVFDYDAFGLRRNPAGNGTPPPVNTTGVNLGFTGHESDDELGLINMRGRIYDPRARQFTTTDPLRSVAPGVPGLSPYMYALNNPLSYVDPSGLVPETIYDDFPDEVVLGRVPQFDMVDIALSGDSPAIGSTVPPSIPLNGDQIPVLSEHDREVLSARMGMERGVGFHGVLDRAAPLVVDTSETWRDLADTVFLLESGAGLLKIGVGIIKGGLAVIPRLGKTAVNVAARTGDAAEDVVYHYTTKNAAQSIQRTGLWSQSSATNVGTYTAREATENLGVKGTSEVVITIRNEGRFVPNKPSIVQPHPLGPGGGVDLTNPVRVGPECILCITPVSP